MKRLIEKTVLVGLVTAWRLATVPTRRSPDWVKATTDGVVRPPSAFSMTVGSPPSRTAMHELVVPRSIPMVLAILRAPQLRVLNKISVRFAEILAQRRSPVRAHPQQRALPARGPPGVAGAAPVAEQVDVQLDLAAGRRQPQHLVVQLLERRAGAEQPEPRADARDVRVDRHVRQP